MKILVLNAGSSSLKFELFDTRKKFYSMISGIVDGIGLDRCQFRAKYNNRQTTFDIRVPNHRKALTVTFEVLLDKKIIKSLQEIDAVGNRVVHGGEKYRDATLIDANVMRTIKKLCELAPLHNPHNLEGIKACKEILPKVPQVAVFDTAFHQTIPEKAYLYAIPYKYYKKEGIRRYGFHGAAFADPSQAIR